MTQVPEPPHPSRGQNDMSLKITDTTMTSAVTPHTAMAWPVPEVPGEPTLWSVTWLPGRALTRNEAVTAMTIAETLALHPDALTSADRRWRMLLEPWAHELYLSANEAAELLAAPPHLGMEEPRSTPEPPPVRANALGNPCPDWCTVEHVSQNRTVNLHIGDPVGNKSPLETRVKLIQDGSDRYRHERPEVSLSKSTAVVHLNHAQSEGLADLLEALADDCTPDQLRAIAAEVRTGASLIDPLPQLSATVAEMTADREPELG